MNHSEIMKFLRISICSIILLLLIKSYGYSQRIVCYYDNNHGLTAGLDYTKMTHLILGFYNPMVNTGAITTATTVWYNNVNFTNIVSAARASNPNIRVLLTTGGTGPSDPTLTARFSAIAASAGATNTMLNACILQIKNNNLDGWDFDWEFPTTTADKNNPQTLLAKMRAKLDSLGTTLCKKMELTIALSGETNHNATNPTGTDYVNSAIISSLDYVHLMTYDCDLDNHLAAGINYAGDHSSLGFAKEAVIGYTSPPFSWPASKLLIGIAFYGRTTASPHTTTSNYNAINSINSAAIFNTDFSGGYGYNGGPTIGAKIRYAKQQGCAGTFVWEVTEDLATAGANSLLKCMYDTTIAKWGTYAYPSQTCCQQPALGNDTLTCQTGYPSSGTVTLNSHTTVGSGTYVWKDLTASTTLAACANSATCPVTYNTLHTYAVIRSEVVGGVTCIKSDTIKVVGSLAALTALPTPTTLCTAPNYSSVYAYASNASSFPSSTTWQWQSSAVNITGATKDSLDIKNAGTYLVKAMVPGCGTVTSNNVVVSGGATATAVNQCSSTNSSTIILSVSGTGPFTWYDADVPGGNQVATGTSYTIPVAHSPNYTATYYVEDASALTSYTIPVDPAAPAGTGASAQDITAPVAASRVMAEFQVTSPVKLKTVDVWAWDGTCCAHPLPYAFMVQIFNASDPTTSTTPLFTSSVITVASSATTGWHTVTLNATLIQGNYRMEAIDGGGTNHAYLFSGANTPVHPYAPTANFVSANGNVSIYNFANLSQLGFFFNWKFDDYGGCKRIPVIAQWGNCSTGLPVEWMAFDADLLSDHSVALTWSTASEFNSSKFDVERSINGANYAVIGTVAAHGNSQSTRDYSFFDKSVPEGTVYYRLAQYDNDGKFAYSTVRTVEHYDLGLKIMPNPFNGTTTIQLAGLETSDVVIKLFDMEGRELETHTSSSRESNNLVVGQNLKSGIYFVQAIGSKGAKTYKLIKE